MRIFYDYKHSNTRLLPQLSTAIKELSDALDLATLELKKAHEYINELEEKNKDLNTEICNLKDQLLKNTTFTYDMKIKE